MENWTAQHSLALVQSKVIRRAEVSRLARVLQGRLALASYKTKNGLQRYPLDTIEPKVDEQLQQKRKRRLSDTTASSDSPQHSGPMNNASFYSEADLDWVRNGSNNSRRLRQTGPPSVSSRSSRATPSKQRGGINMNASDSAALMMSGSSKSTRKRTRMEMGNDFLPPPSSKRRGWNFPASSPGYDYGWRNLKNASFMSNASVATAIDEEDDTPDVPVRSPDASFRSSPPQTPPRRKDPSGEEGAGLLLYFAGSPLADKSAKAAAASGSLSSGPLIPMTPPTHNSNLPSAMMRTPVPQTPSQFPFNLSEFCNITPSPMPKKRNSISGLGRGTPGARMGLTFDSPGEGGILGLPLGTPSRGGGGRMLEFGKELTSRT